MPEKAKQKMRSNGHSDCCVCPACVKLVTEEKENEIMVYGKWKTFRDFVDGMCDMFDVEKAYIYPKFAVLDFRWTADAKKLHDYLEDRSATRYTGIHFDQNSFLLVIIDVAKEEEVDGNKSI